MSDALKQYYSQIRQKLAFLEQLDRLVVDHRQRHDDDGDRSEDQQFQEGLHRRSLLSLPETLTRR